MKPLILVVDDDEPIRVLVQTILEAAGFEVATAWSGEQALKYLVLGRPDLFIIDLQMPQMTGIELMQRIRLRRHFGQTPIMMMTASTLGVDIQAAIRAGAGSYLLKPFTDRDLLARAAALLDGRKNSDDPVATGGAQSS